MGTCIYHSVHSESNTITGTLSQSPMQVLQNPMAPSSPRGKLFPYLFPSLFIVNHIAAGPSTQPRVLASVFKPSYSRDSDNTTYLLRRVRDLQGSIGVVHEGSVSVLDQPLNTGLGRQVDCYLSTHGYTRESADIIADAYSRYLSGDMFVAYLCGRGVPQLEAEWIWGFIFRCQQEEGH